MEARHAPVRPAATLVVLALVVSLVVLPSPGEAVVIQASQVFLHEKVKSFLGRTDQRTMDAFRPTSPEDSRQILSAIPVTWALDLELGAAEAFKITSDVEGVVWYDTGETAATLKIFNMTLYDLPPNGTLLKIGEASEKFQRAVHSEFDPFASKPSIRFLIPPSNLTNPVIERGHSLAIGLTAIPDVSVSQTTPGNITVIYDSESHPSYLNFTYETATLAKVRLLAEERDLTVEPGGSTNFTVSLRNEGDLDDTINITNSTLSPGWDVIFSKFRFRMPGNTSENFTVQVVAPPQAPARFIQAVAVFATSSRGATDVIDLQARVAGEDLPPPGETCPDGTLKPPAGDCPDEDNETGGGGGDGNGQVAEPFDPLKPVSDTFRSTFATVPALHDNADNLALVSLALFVLLVLLLILSLLSTKPKILLKLKAARLLVEPGKARLLDIVVTNKGRLPEYVQLGIEPMPTAWIANLARTEFTLDPRESVTLGLLLRPPADWPAPSKKTVEVVLRSKRRPKYERSASAKVIVVRPGRVREERPSKEKRVKPVREKGKKQPRAAATAPVPKEDVFSLSADAGEELALPEAELPEIPTPEERPLIEKELESGLPAEPLPGTPSGFEDVHIAEVKNEPEEVVRGEIVTTSVVLENAAKRDAGGIAVRLIVNEKLRDQKVVAIKAGRRMTITFKWEAYLSNNSVRVQVA